MSSNYEKQGTGYDSGATGHELQGRATLPIATTEEVGIEKAREQFTDSLKKLERIGLAIVPIATIRTLVCVLGTARAALGMYAPSSERDMAIADIDAALSRAKAQGGE